jgi:hypothetical protein
MLIDALVLLGLFAALLAAIYGLYRCGRYFKRHGWLYDRDAPSSGGSVFLPLQELIEPQIQHVEQVKEQRLKKADDESGSGSNDPG